MPHKKSPIHGFGINDAPFPVSKSNHTDEDGVFHKKWLNPTYVWWRNAITRSYSTEYQERFPTYAKTAVCQEWKHFTKFNEWALEHSNGSFKDKVLDKDIIGDGSLYSPDTCCLVSVKVNSFLIASESQRVVPVGVYYENFSGKYVAQVTINKKPKKLGRFDNLELARLVYCRAKLDLAFKLVEEENLEECIAVALINKLQKKVDEAEILYQQSLI